MKKISWLCFSPGCACVATGSVSRRPLVLGHKWFPAPAPDPLIISPTHVRLFCFHASFLIIPPFSIVFPIRLPQPPPTHCSHLHQRFVRHGTFSLKVRPSPTIPIDNRQAEPQREIISAKMLFTQVCSLPNGVGLVHRWTFCFSLQWPGGTWNFQVAVSPGPNRTN